jgi:CheY-like chemotaxis protein
MSDEELRFVVVDDVPDAADSLAMLLRMSGHEVRTAYGGQEALDVVESYQPDCVLLDLAMPKMRGGELARLLRQRHGTALVLIAVTGDSDVDVARSPELAHVDHCLRKPVERAELAKMLSLPAATRAAGRTATSGGNPT